MSNKYTVKGSTIAGLRTVSRGLENQDYIKIYEDEKRIMLCVSDGCTGCNAPREAAIINCNVAENIAKVPTIWQMGDRKFKSIIAEKYEDAFECADESYEELAATTAFVIINKKTNKYIAFACGDTAVLSFDASLNTKQLIAPMNIGKKTSTIFTNQTALLKKYGTFVTGTLDNGVKGFVVYSDGAEAITNQPNDYFKNYLASAFISDEVYEKEEQDLFEGLQTLTKDDISVGIISLMDEEIQTNACNVYYNLEYTEKKEREEPKITEIEHTEKKKYEKKQTIVRDESKLLQFLKEPAGIEEIVDSGLIKREEIILALTNLIRNGIVTCGTDNTFRAV